MGQKHPLMNNKANKAVLNCPELETLNRKKKSVWHTGCVMDPLDAGEVKKAIQRLENGKTAGIAQVQPEFLKYSTAISVDKSMQ